MNINQYSIAYRPRVWEDLYGQDEIVKDLRKRILENNIPKAVLFRGPFGTGKTTLAEIFAAAIQSSLPDGNPNWETLSTKTILNETFNRDTIQFNGAEMRGVESMEALIAQTKTRPMYDKRRVIIIEEADQISATAMKSLLKVLESPDPYTVFILLSMEDKKGIPESIESRCQVYKVKPSDILSTMKALRAVMEKTGDWTNPEIPDSFRLEGLKAIATCAKGCLRNAFQYLEKCITSNIWTKEAIEDSFEVMDEEKTWRLLDGILDKTKDERIWSTIIGLKNTQGDDGAQHFYRYAVMLLSEALILKQTGFAYEGESAKPRLMRMANNPDAERLFYCLTLNPQLSKPYMTTSDLLGALAAFYLGMDFRPQTPTTAQPTNPTPQRVAPATMNTTLKSPAPENAELDTVTAKSEPIPTRAIPTRQKKEEPKVVIGRPNYELPITPKNIPSDFIY